MKTEQDVIKTLALFRHYRTSGRYKVPDNDTRQNCIGVEAALEWVLGIAEDGPVADTIGLIKGTHEGN